MARHLGLEHDLLDRTLLALGGSMRRRLVMKICKRPNWDDPTLSESWEATTSFPVPTPKPSLLRSRVQLKRVVRETGPRRRRSKPSSSKRVKPIPGLNHFVKFASTSVRSSFVQTQAPTDPKQKIIPQQSSSSLTYLCLKEKNQNNNQGLEISKKIGCSNWRPKPSKIVLVQDPETFSRIIPFNDW